MPRVTEEDLALWSSHLDKGMSYRQVAEVTGARRATVAKHLPGRGLTSRVTEADLALWSSYLDEGMPYRKVAEVTGADRETIARHLPGRGWTPEQGRQFGTFMKHANEKLRAIRV